MHNLYVETSVFRGDQMEGGEWKWAWTQPIGNQDASKAPGTRN